MASLKERQRKLRKDAIKREIKKFNPINEKYILDEGLAKAILPSQALLEREIIVEDSGFFSGHILAIKRERLRIRDIMDFIERGITSEDPVTKAFSLNFMLHLPVEITINYFEDIVRLKIKDAGALTEVASRVFSNMYEKSRTKRVLTRENLSIVENFIEKNWNKREEDLRAISARGIMLLPNEIAKDYLHYLAILCNDPSNLVRANADSSWANLNPREWAVKMSKEELRKVLMFMDSNMDSNIDYDKKGMEGVMYRLFTALPGELVKNYIGKNRRKIFYEK